MKYDRASEIAIIDDLGKYKTGPLFLARKEIFGLNKVRKINAENSQEISPCLSKQPR